MLLIPGVDVETIKQAGVGAARSGRGIGPLVACRAIRASAVKAEEALPLALRFPEPAAEGAVAAQGVLLVARAEPPGCRAVPDLVQGLLLQAAQHDRSIVVMAARDDPPVPQHGHRGIGERARHGVAGAIVPAQ